MKEQRVRCITNWEVYHQVMKTHANITFKQTSPKNHIHSTGPLENRPSTTNSEDSSRTRLDDSGEVNPIDGEINI
jgi:hypothetical protein